MDYEKKYKNALEWARQVMNGETGFIRKEVEEVFPELKENEDERIKKIIKSALDSYFEGKLSEGTNDVDYAVCCTWLKKQGEQKPTQEIEPTPIFKIGDILKRKGKDYTFRVDRIQGGYYHCDRNHGAFFPIEEQGNWELVEQKPADKVEPKFKVKYAGSEYNVLKVKDIAGVTYYGIEDEPNHIDYVQAENCERVGGYGIKEKGSPYPTKPAVFSEHNPAWSEEDEGICIEAIKLLTNQSLYETCINLRTEIVDWLKSLKDRYTWKPSEGQMKALNYVVNLMASSESPRENDYYYNVFNDLRKQLKKLKEE